MILCSKKKVDNVSRALEHGWVVGVNSRCFKFWYYVTKSYSRELLSCWTSFVEVLYNMVQVNRVFMEQIVWCLEQKQKYVVSTYSTRITAVISWDDLQTGTARNDELVHFWKVQIYLVFVVSQLNFGIYKDWWLRITWDKQQFDKKTSSVVSCVVSP